MSHFFIGLTGFGATIGGALLVASSAFFPDHAIRMETIGTLFVIGGMILIGTQVASVF